MTRILLLNPNTSESVTALMADVARNAVPAGVTIHPVTAPRGVPYIATRAEAAIGGAVVLEMLAELEGTFDAAVVAAFGDPGLGAAREMLDVPVVGLAEAAMLTACMLGRRFSIVSFSETLGPWYRECVEAHFMTERLASLRLLEGGFARIDGVRDEKEDALVELARRTVDEDGADVIVLAGAPLAGLVPRVRNRIPIPVVEGIAAAVNQAALLARLGTIAPTAGSFSRPAPKPSIGLAPSLERLLSGRPATNARSDRAPVSETMTS